MRIRRSCREVTALVLQGQDRRLLPMERLVLRLHWMVCDRCRHFRRQADTVQLAMRHWRAYREAEAPADEGATPRKGHPPPPSDR